MYGNIYSIGVPPIYGIISGIIGGIIVGALSGAPLQVSGPAAGLAVMVFDFVARYGLEALAPLGIFIGVFQILAYKFGTGVYFKAVSPALLKGLLVGIGGLIFSSQLFVGLDLNPVGTGVKNLIMFPETFIENVINTKAALHPFLVCMGTLITIIAWGKIKFKFAKVLPAPLMGVILSSAVCSFLGLNINYVSIPENIMDGLNIISMKSFTDFTPAFVLACISIAFVASVETLLCTNATDVLSKSGSSDYNKEIMAQGVGHVVAGILGVLPITGVIVRSTANIESGAKTRISTVLHGLWLLLFVFVASNVLELIPISTLSAILLVVGYKLMDFSGVKKLVTSSKQNAFIFLTTITLILSFDLMTGVIAGFGMSLIVLIKDLLNLDVKTEEEKISLKGNLTFLQIPKLNNHLSEIEKYDNAVVDLSEVEYIDQGANTELNNWESIVKSQGKNVQLIRRKKSA